jgi:hypothetical protein
VLQCGLQWVAADCNVLQFGLRWVAVGCSVLQWVAVRYSVLQCVAVCCSAVRVPLTPFRPLAPLHRHPGRQAQRMGALVLHLRHHHHRLRLHRTGGRLAVGPAGDGERPAARRQVPRRRGRNHPPAASAAHLAGVVVGSAQLVACLPCYYHSVCYVFYVLLSARPLPAPSVHCPPQVLADVIDCDDNTLTHSNYTVRCWRTSSTTTSSTAF